MPQLAEIMGALGRGSDTMAAHVTPGDFVVPRAVIDNDPAVLSAIIKAFGKTSEKMGQPLDWRTHLVAGGMNHQNPISGAPEFFVGNAEGSGPASGDTSGIGDDGSAGSVAGIGGDAGVGDGTAGVGGGTVSGSEGVGSLVGDVGNDAVADGGSGGGTSLSQALASMFGFETGRNSFESKAGTPNAYGSLALALGGLAVPGLGMIGGLANAMGATPSQSNSPQGVDGIEGAIGDALGEGAISRGNAENIRQAVAAYNRPAEATAPVSLGLAGMSPLQQRSAIATGAVASNNPAFRDTSARDYYRNLLQRSFVNDDGSLRDINELLPVEQQYLSAIGLGAPSTTQALLQSIASA